MPHFFGFNVEWTGFQEDYWEREASAAKRDLIEALLPFEGAVYRYPGGTVANYFDWRSAVGPQDSRPAQRAMGWRPPVSAVFGFEEYLDFLTRVKGRAWLVANLYGRYDEEKSETAVAAEAGSWAAAARMHGADVLAWELGNELDRDRFSWPANKYISRASAVSAAIRASDPDSRLVGMLEDFDARRDQTSREYNSQTSRALATFTQDYALHLYYDGRPGGPPIPQRLRHLCDSVAAVESASRKTVNIWVTEHARWPGGRTDDPSWEQNWPKTTNLDGALSVGDMLIALTQVSRVNGAFLHSLARVSGPWPLFHAGMPAPKPSAVYWALRLLREDLMEYVLDTRVSSANRSGYVGGYDLRASVLTNTKRDAFAVWAVNRFSYPLAVKLSIPMLAGRSEVARQVAITDPDLSASNVRDENRIRPQAIARSLSFNHHGSTVLELPPHSVSSTRINVR